MPVQALKTVSKSQNGLGAFILQCRRLDFHYCDWAGSSRGMNKLLTSLTNSSSSTASSPTATTTTTTFIPTSQLSTTSTPQVNSRPLLTNLTTRYPTTEFRVSPRPHRHPVLKAYYINGNTKAVCVRNLDPAQIIQKAELLLQNSGTKNKKIRGRNVLSSNEGVRGIWSALHGGIKRV